MILNIGLETSIICRGNLILQHLNAADDDLFNDFIYPY